MAADPLAGLIRDLDRQIAVLQKKVNLLRQAQAVGGGQEAAATPQGPSTKREPAIRPGSSVGMAAAILGEAGEELHVDELVKRINTRGGQATKQTLVSSLSRLSKAKAVFYRAAQPNTFGLLGARGETVGASGQNGSART